jgi:cell division protein FtsB
MSEPNELFIYKVDHCGEIYECVEKTEYDNAIKDRDFCKTQWDMTSSRWQTRYMNLATERNALKAEVERLKDEKQRHYEVALSAETRRDLLAKERNELRAEVERLKAEVERLKVDNRLVCELQDAAVKDYNKEREINRVLVEALERFAKAKHSYGDSMQMAREALAKVEEMRNGG